MKWFLDHWYDVGGVLAIPLAVWAWQGSWSTVQLILLLNAIALLIHQFEEYRLPGGEAWITNQAMQVKAGGLPDRYPLNQVNAAFINVTAVFWYLIPIFFPQAVWLGLAPVLFGVGQFGMHGIATPLKLKKFYNPGLAAVTLGHIPLAVWYIATVYQQGLIQWWDWPAAIVYAISFMGIVMLWIGYGVLSPKNSRHPFPTEEMNRWSRVERLRHAGLEDNYRSS